MFASNFYSRKLIFAERWKHHKNQNPQNFRATRYFSTQPHLSHLCELLRCKMILYYLSYLAFHMKYTRKASPMDLQCINRSNIQMDCEDYTCIGSMPLGTRRFHRRFISFYSHKLFSKNHKPQNYICDFLWMSVQFSESVKTP